ncbi:MAG: CapA family protein [Melioribacteraceae bacterium]|nr:CapA family protein [Melioribacteraceae bacterium]
MQNIFKTLLFITISSISVIADSNISSEDSTATLEFSVVGDIMCHSTQFKFAEVAKDSFNFKPVYREIKKYLDNSDVVIGNLETVIEVDSLKYAGYPVFNTPKDFLEGLKYAGFDILSTANNHAFDIRERGVKSTIEHIKNYNLKNVGTHLSNSERDSVRIFEQNNIKFALLSYTYGVNLYKIPLGKEYLVNFINEELIKNDIKNHRDAGAELIIIFFHFGTEYAAEANRYQIDIVNKSISFGADIILGAHPHSLQPIEYFKTEDGNVDSGFVAYSLGNFISNQRWRYSDGGAILNFSIQKNNINNSVKITGVRYLPIWVYKGYTKNGAEYIILPSEIALQDSSKKYLSDEDLALMKECYFDTQMILESKSDKVKIDSIEKSNFRKLKKEYFANRYFIDRIPILKYDFRGQNVYKDTLEFIDVDLLYEFEISDYNQ